MQTKVFLSFTLLLFANTPVWSRSIDTGGCLNRHEDSPPGEYADSPELKLPWGTYQGKTYGPNKNVTVFKNVRYGQAPVGDLRFKASKFPEATDNSAEIQDTSFGPICIQAAVNGSQPVKAEETEDCLFLDIYVPSAALKKGAEELPVVVYLYGGAFFYGYKDTTLDLGSQKFNLYDGQGPMNASGNDFIWVVGNYRVGAFGWLAGSTMEKDGTPNAGLHDQKLMLEFVKQHIGKVNGLPDYITVWGNSAGASSIMHHLTAGENGDAGPEFHAAALWSPAYQWSFDRKGALENTFTAFAKAAGCGASVSCLQKASVASLRNANQAIVNTSLAAGSFPFGPALDGSYVKYLPTTQFGRRSYKLIRSIIVSHVADEAGLFLPKLSWINSEEKFQAFLNITFPGELADVREAVTETYPVLGDDDKKINQILRTKRFLQDSTFLCNSRVIIESYQQRSWLMKFDFPPGLHGSDLLPATWTKEVNTGKLIDEILGPSVNDTTKRLIESKLAGFSSTYQKYFAGFATYGNPNVLIEDEDEYWPPVDYNRFRIVDKVLHVGLDNKLKPAFTVSPDLLLSTSQCSLWSNIADYLGDGNDLGGSEYDKKVAALHVQPEL